jgi:hypothetical protein
MDFHLVSFQLRNATLLDLRDHINLEFVGNSNSAHNLMLSIGF